MIDLGKKPDGAFFAADEGMATNILASWLAQLVQARMLAKKPYATDQRKTVYALTEKGLALLPILREVANGSVQHDPQIGTPPVWIALVNADKAKMISRIRATARALLVREKILRSRTQASAAIEQLT